MQMIYIAVLLVMAVLNLFLAFIIWQMAAVTRRQVQKNMAGELENSAAALDMKMEELKGLEEEKKKIQGEIDSLEGVVLSLKTSPFYAPRAIARELFIPTARYIDNEFFDNHKLVNDMMKDVDWKKIVENIRSRYIYAGDRERYETACGILENLDMETVYGICTRDPQEQESILEEAFTGRTREMLEEFRSGMGEDEDFDVLKFRTFVREISVEHDPRVYIRTGDRNPARVDDNPDIVYQYDSNISEGLKIIYQNRSFDFSIYRLRSRK